jgi:6-phosphogluconate dehydrogenase
MELGVIGLGRMGANMSQRLMDGGHRIVAYDRDAGAVQTVASAGAVGASSLEQLVAKLSPQRAVWLMVPSGAPVEQTIHALAPLLSPGDAIIDGGNSYYKDSVRRAASLKKQRLHFLDVGTSGGIWGLKMGYCLMIGGAEEVFRRLEPIFQTLAPEEGYAYMGSSGAGHFVKMVHNGIEYGLLQAYAEGFELLHASPYELDLAQLARLWNRGSVVRSWLLELTEKALAADPDLASVRDYVQDSGEGRWTVLEAVERGVPLPVISLSLLTRFRSQQDESFSAKVIAALRREFGGHPVKSD